MKAHAKFQFVQNWFQIVLLFLVIIFVVFLAELQKWEQIPTTLFSATTALFAYYAYRFSAERFRLDLLDRRWIIYENVLEFCRRVIQQGRLRFDDASREETLKAIRAAEQSFRGTGWHKSKTLFGPDVIALLEKLNESFSWLSAFDHAPEDAGKRQKWADEWAQHTAFIWKTVNDLPETFRPYVYFGNYRKN